MDVCTRLRLYLLPLLLLEGFAFGFLSHECQGCFFAHLLFAILNVGASQQGASAVGAEDVEVAFHVLCLEVEELLRVDEFAQETCLEVQVGTRGASRIAAQSDDVACANYLIRLAEVLAHVAVNGLESVGMTDDYILSVAFAISSSSRPI